MELTELIKFMILFSTLLFIIAAFIGVVIKFYIHLSNILSIPLYAGMIFIEIVISGFGIKEVSRVFSFSKPKIPWQRITMDIFAFFCVLLGVVITMSPLFRTPDIFIPKYLSGEAIPVGIPVMFIFSLCVVYIFNFLAPEDSDDPFRKLEKLGLPGVLGKYLVKSPNN